MTDEQYDQANKLKAERQPLEVRQKSFEAIGAILDSAPVGAVQIEFRVSGMDNFTIVNDTPEGKALTKEVHGILAKKNKAALDENKKKFKEL